jgi:hypothetical protein
MLNTSPTPEEGRLLNSWNTARHGRNRFQTSSRRATERLARKLLPDFDDQTNHSTTSTSQQEKPPMDARTAIHTLLNLDENTKRELDNHLDTLEAAAVANVLVHVEYSCGDMAAEQVRDSLKDAAEAPPIDLHALQAAGEAEKNQVCVCGHFRDKHHRDFHNGGGITCGTCDCQNFTDRQDTYTPA